MTKRGELFHDINYISLNVVIENDNVMIIIWILIVFVKVSAVPVRLY